MTVIAALDERTICELIAQYQETVGKAIALVRFDLVSRNKIKPIQRLDHEAGERGIGKLDHLVHLMLSRPKRVALAVQLCSYFHAFSPLE